MLLSFMLARLAFALFLLPFFSSACQKNKAPPQEEVTSQDMVGRRDAGAYIRRYGSPAPGVPLPKGVVMPEAVALTLHPKLAAVARTFIGDACLHQKDEKPSGEIPNHLAIVLGDTPEKPERCSFPRIWLKDNTSPAVIYVIPADAFREGLPSAGRAMGELKGLLETRPKTAKVPMPFAPFRDAHQAFAEHVRYVDHHSGSGVLFLTEFAIEPDSLGTEMELIYQGFGRGGSQFVFGIFPVTTDLQLPSFANEAGLVDDKTVKRHELYTKKIARLLRDAKDEAFHPRPSWIAETLSSLSLNSE